MTSSDGIVYFVLDATRLEQRVKIGFSTNLASRLRALAEQTVCGNVPIVLALEGGGQARERELHKRFKTARLHGEWFNYECPELRQYIADLPNPQGWLLDDMQRWVWSGGALRLPAVPLQTIEMESRWDDDPDGFRYTDAEREADPLAKPDRQPSVQF